MGGKVAELRFFEIWKNAISRQTMDKNRGQSVHYKKDVHIVAPRNSLFREIMRVDFDIFGDYALSETAISQKISLRSQNRRKIPGNSNEILIFDRRLKEMERAGRKTRDIQFYSEKNSRMVCLHSSAERDYAKYLEKQPWVESYEAGAKRYRRSFPT